MPRELPSQIRTDELRSYDWFYGLDHFLGRARVDALFGERRARARARLLARLREDVGQVVPIERVEGLSPRDFVSRYLRNRTPVVLAGAAADWPCRREWSLSTFSEAYGATEAVVLPEARTTSGFRGTREPEQVRSADFETLIGEMRGGSGTYIRFSPIIEDRPELAAQLDFEWLRARLGPLAPGYRVYAFLGGGGSRTRLHCDMPPNLFVQVHGRKHWMLFPPAYRVLFDPLLERSSLSYTTNFEVRPEHLAPDEVGHHVHRFEGVLEPGDVLYNPAYMWHDVQNLSESVAVSVRWLSPGVHWRAPWNLQLQDLLSNNPPIWRAGLQKRDINENILEAKEGAKRDPDYLG